MLKDGRILVGIGNREVFILPEMANRHGLIAGATGTGKTVTLKVMAESFSTLGVPVFLADVKGDLSGCCEPGEANDSLDARLTRLGIEPKTFPYTRFPTRFWDVYGKAGHPVRTTASEMGAMLLARLLNLTNVQTGVLSIVFRIADDKGWLLTDLKDLRAMVAYVSDHAQDFLNEYGNVSRQSAGAIQRALLQLEDAGGTSFFGEPNIQLEDWIKCDDDGKGFINILNCEKLFQSPLLYSTFMLWLLAELFEQLPEVGDLEKPKLVFFFDEAHLLFKDAPRTLLDKIEQVVRLIRSKGVGVYFITQQPADIPESVLAQLGNRVQHALRAYTPSEQKAIRAAANSFRTNPEFDTAEVLQQLGTGEALVSFLDRKGVPEIVEQAIILPPQSFMGKVGDKRLHAEIETDGMFGMYEEPFDRRSAYEILMEQKQKAEQEETDKASKKEAKKKEEKTTSTKKKKSSKTGSALNKVASSTISSIGREIGRSIARGLLGTIKKLF